MSEWQDIASAPRDGRKILGWVSNVSTSGIINEIAVIWYSQWPGMWVHGASYGPTMWMPLPTPPTKPTQEES